MIVLLLGIFIGANFGVLVVALIVAARGETPARPEWHTHRPTDESVLP